MNIFRKFKNTQRGVSLIELLIALVLGLLVTGGVLQLFFGTKQTHVSNQALARVQENARFVAEDIKREFRMIGTHGFCAARLTINSHLNTTCSDDTDAIFSVDTPVIGWDYDGTGRNEALTISDLDPTVPDPDDWTHQRADGTTVDLPSFLEDRVVPGTDVVVIRRLQAVESVTGSAGAVNSPANSVVSLNLSSGLEANELALVTNCTGGADLFQNMSAAGASAISTGASSCSSPGPGNLASVEWTTVYDDTSQLFRANVFAYYVGFNDERQEPGLYRADLSRGIAGVRHEELAEGIENLQMLFGYSLPADQGGDGQSVDFWLTGGEVPDWNFVIGARAAFVIRSPESAEIGQVQRTFDLSGTAITHPEDSRLRQPFSVSMSFRNQQIVQ